MARKDKRRGNRETSKYSDRRERPGFWRGLREETRRSIIGILFVVLAFLLFFAGLGSGGIIGESIFHGTHFVFGVGYWALPILSLLLGINFFRATERSLTGPALISGPFFVLSALGLLSLPSVRASAEDALGGWIGFWTAKTMVAGIGFASATIALFAIFLISVLFLFDLPLHLGFLALLFSWIPKRAESQDREISVTSANTTQERDAADTTEKPRANSDTPEPHTKPAPPPPESRQPEMPEESEESEVEPAVRMGISEKPSSRREQAKFLFRRTTNETFVPPPLSLLSSDRGKASFGDPKANSLLIKRTLQNYGIEVEMGEITVGPTVTRYTLRPAESVRLSKIVALQRELEYALALSPIRIEAPIPGKSLVGIEVPNTEKATVGLAGLLENPEWSSNPNPLFVPIGKSITGEAHYINIARMPHLLIAGATGSGKSVAIHSIITSLLYRQGPEQLRLILVDPKRVELTLYDGIPHLLTPVITDGKKAILALKWVAKEMDRRYDVLKEVKCRDIGSYHSTIFEPAIAAYEQAKAAGRATEEDAAELPESMPFIVVAIDEIADIMQMYPRELESSIARLAQMSRAVGIHLILATQSPRVQVITGHIKANVPARIALAVNSQVDSRVILDLSGAENLLGKGDLLFLSNEMAKPVRLQCAFVSESEVKAVVKFLKENSRSTLGDEIVLGKDESGIGASTAFGVIPEDSLAETTEADDEMYEEAKKIVIESGKASTSLLQRRLRLGYGRAAKIIDMLEQNGIVGPGNGAKPREVLVKPSGGNSMNASTNDFPDDHA